MWLKRWGNAIPQILHTPMQTLNPAKPRSGGVLSFVAGLWRTMAVCKNPKRQRSWPGRSGGRMTGNASIHSDLLVHWTGRDLDVEYDPKWSSSENCKMRPGLAHKYLDRLRDILKHGLWMTMQKAESYSKECVAIPETPGLCFTELKLSQSRSHASRYGRLGIAVKRPFLFERGGRPITYFNGRRGMDPFMRECVETFKDRRLLQFFKPMDAKSKGPMGYDFYDESEWRIIPPSGPAPGWLVDPRTARGEKLRAWHEALLPESRSRLQYLVPLDGWLAAIIYPSHIVKNFAHKEGSGIRELLVDIAKSGWKYSIEGLNLPAELDLDLCRHF